jgi:hypothetical protein
MVKQIDLTLPKQLLGYYQILISNEKIELHDKINLEEYQYLLLLKESI